MSAPRTDDQSSEKAPRRPRSLRRRGNQPQTLIGRVIKAIGRPTPRNSKAARKRELMVLARAAGWRGQTYGGAKKFERRLNHEARANGAPV